MKIAHVTVLVACLGIPLPVVAVTVPLTVANREAVAKTAEPVTSGVPFAQGVVSDVGRLRLMQGATELPGQFLVTARWPDGSIRWVLVDTQVNLPASGSASFTLETGTAPSVVPGIAVTETPSALRVDTLARSFDFTKSDFTVRGLTLQLRSGGALYLAVPNTWSIEESGAMKVVVRVDGVWRHGDTPLINDLNRFRARLVFSRGRADMRVFLTLRNNNSYGWDERSGGQPHQPDVTFTEIAFGAASLLPANGIYHVGSGVHTTWEVDVAADGSPTNRRTRYDANGALVGGDGPPRPLAVPVAGYFASTKAWGVMGLPVTGQAADRQADFDRFELIHRAKVDRSVVEDPPGLRGITVWEHLSQDLARWNDYGDLRWGGECGPFSGNHYDWPFGMFLQFMRTGVLSFADLARVMARHEVDFDVYHSGADSAAFNYQKNWETRPTHDNPGNCFGGGRPSHTWSQGYALFWLLTGDRRGKDAFDELQEGVRQYVYESFNGEGYINTSEIRIQGWLIENLVNLWRINPDALLATSTYGDKSIRAAIRDVLRSVFERETAAGQQGFVLSDGDPGGYLRQTLPHVYFLEPAIKAYDEVFAGQDVPYAAALLGLITRMTTWLSGTAYGGDTNAAGDYRPYQIPYWVDTRLSVQAHGELPYLLMVANAAGFLYTTTSDPSWRDRARDLFRDYVRYVGAIGHDQYGDPSVRTPAAYNSNVFSDTESKIHGWSSRYGQYYLASDGGGVGPGPSPQIAATPAALRFGATKDGSAGNLVSVTGPQPVTVTFVAGTGNCRWQATPGQAWLVVNRGTGDGAGQFTVSVTNVGNVIGANLELRGGVTVSCVDVGSTPLAIPVIMTIDQTGGATTRSPLGLVDTPLPDTAGIVGTIGVTGWAVDDVGVAGVQVYRTCLGFEPAVNCRSVAGRDVVFVGDATLVEGARPAVEALYATYPQANRAAWGYLLLTILLPHVPNQQMFGGQGTFTFHALATDVEGKQTWLGRTTEDADPTTITLANDTITKPFGAIDTPAQGAVVSGTFANFGWALTPDNNTTGGESGDIVVPADGSTLRVYIDGVPGAFITYNQCRGNVVQGPVPAGVWCNDDVASIFGHPIPQPTFAERDRNETPFRNLDQGRGAIGALLIDTTTLSNGVHTIMWGVTDSAGRGEGLGSRYFTVLNAGSDGLPALGSRLPAKTETPIPAEGRTAYGARLPASAEAPTATGRPARAQDAADDAPGLISARTGLDPAAPWVRLKPDDEGVRHVTMPDLGRLELRVGADVDAAYLMANGERRSLPPGSHLDAQKGLFTWAPGVGYVGTYRLTFIRDGQEIHIDVTIAPNCVQSPGQRASLIW